VHCYKIEKTSGWVYSDDNKIKIRMIKRNIKNGGIFSMKKTLLFCIALLIVASLCFTSTLKVQYMCGDHGAVTDNHIKPHLNIVNTGTESVSFSDLTVRYYYTKEGLADETFQIDYAQIGGSHIIGSFREGYCEVSFMAGAGDLLPGNQSGPIQIRFNMDDWKNYDESDDYSYNKSFTTYTDWEKVTLYENGILVWGIEPGGSSPSEDPTPNPAPPTPVPGVSTPLPLPEEPLPGIFVESEGMIVMEAEHYSEKLSGSGMYSSSEWKEKSSAWGASNRWYMKALPNKGLNARGSKKAPVMAFTMSVSSPGSYKLWVRKAGNSGSDDSCAPALNDGPTYEWHYGMSYKWKWALCPVIYDLEAGEQILNIYMREDGSMIDKIILTTDSGFRPSGYGPGESVREIEPTPTPEPTPIPVPEGAGEVWLVPASISVSVGSDFSVEVHANTGNQKLAAYGLDVTYDGNIIVLNYSIGRNGVEAGPDGFVATAGVPTPGIIRISGFDASGTGPGTDLYILKIYFTAIGAGTTPLDVRVDELTDPETFTIGNPAGIGGSVTVTDAATQVPTNAPTTPPVLTNPPTATDPPAVTNPPTVTNPPSGGTDAGEVWIEAVPPNVTVGLDFIALVHVNTGDQLIAAYGLDITYDPAVISLITDIGSNGIEPGPDGFVSATSILPSEGLIRVSGFDANGKGPDDDLILLVINFIAIAEGTSAINITVDQIVDQNTANIGVPEGIGASVTVTEGSGAPPPTPEPTPLSTPVASGGLGDVNADGNIDIVDALMMAHYFVGLNPSGFGTAQSDVNGDGMLNIIDALILAQYYVGLVSQLPSDPVPEPTEGPAPLPGTGSIWFVPDVVAATENIPFEIEIHLNSGEQALAAYDVIIEYDYDYLTVNSNTGTSGVIEGADGFLAGVNADNPGVVMVNGFDPTGTGPGQNLHVLTISWIAIASGETSITLYANMLVDPDTYIIGEPDPATCTVTVEEGPEPTETPTPTPSPVETPVSTETPPPTPGPIEGAGEVWFVPSESTVSQGDTFVTELHINSGDQTIGAYGFDIFYDQRILSADDVTAGPDGFVTAVNYEMDNQLRFSGFDVEGSGPGTDLFFLAIEWTALYGGTTPLDLDIRTLVDLDTNHVSFPIGIDGLVTITGDPPPDITDPPTTTATPVSTPTPQRTETPPPTPGPIPGAGEVWLVPSELTVSSGDTFITELHINSGDQRVAAFGFDIFYDPDILSADALISEPYGFTIETNYNIPGQLRTAGFENEGTEPSTDLFFLSVRWTALAEGTSPLDLDVRALVDQTTAHIGVPSGIDGSVTVIGDTPPDETPMPPEEPTPDPTAVPEPTGVPTIVPTAVPDVTAVPTTVPTPVPQPPTEPPAGGSTSAGDVWIVPASQGVDLGSNFFTEIHVNTGSQLLAAYGIEIYYDPSIIEVDTSVGSDGVEAGPDGYLSAVNPNTSGNLIMSGFDASGKGPGEDLHILTVYWTAVGTGTTVIDMVINAFVDDTTMDIGSPAGTGGSVTVM
jgi:hypothetical protein